MLTPEELADLAAHARARGLAALTVEAEDWNLRLEFQPLPAVQPAAPPATCEPATQPVETTGFGTFLPAHPLAPTPFAAPGKAVREGGVLALLRTGLIYRPVRAPTDGTLDCLLVEADTLVGYGEAVARLRHGGAGHG